MSPTITRASTFQLALVASAAIGLSACSKSGSDVAPPVATTTPTTQVAAASVPAPAPAPVVAPVVTPRAPVVVAQNDRAYEQGRRDQQRQDIRHERQDRALREPPPRADRDTDVADQQRWHHDRRLAAAACGDCGVFEAVGAVKVQGQTNGLGAVAGGVGGALVGNRIAGNRNRTLGGVVGAVGGGLLGNAIEKHERTTTVYDVKVRMEDGSVRTVRESTSPAVGEKVRVEADGLHDRS
jgi:outer membrane lipoprotein SlyB